jgi:hypothetical protein
VTERVYISKKRAGRVCDAVLEGPGVDNAAITEPNIRILDLILWKSETGPNVHI